MIRTTAHSAASSISPVRIRMAPPMFVAKILPSPIWSVRADLAIASTTLSTRLAETATSISTFGTKLTAFSAPQ